MLRRLGSLSGHVAHIINAMCGLLQRDDLKNTLLLQDVGRDLEKAPRNLVCSHRFGMELAFCADVSLTKRSHWASAGRCLLVAVQHLAHELFRICMTTGNS